MIFGLIEKEWRQHGAMILFVLILLTTGFVVLQRMEVLVQYGGSNFALLDQLLFYLLPIACLVIGNALIAAEFRQRTQVFLEGLPMPRWLMIAVKYGLGLVFVLVAAGTLLGVAFWSADEAEAMTIRFALLLWIRTLGWAWFCWSAIFTHAFLGRYRIAMGVGIIGMLLWAQQEAGVMITRFGPFELVSDRFAYERFEFPVEALWITGILIIVITSFGFALGLVRDASLATMLSEKMSAREKMALTALCVLGMVLAGSAAERKEKSESLQLPGAIDVVLGVGNVSAAAAVKEQTSEETEALRSHATAAAELLASAADYLGCKTLPPLFMVHRRDMDDQELEDGELNSRQGYLIRLNMISTHPESVALRARLLQKTLAAHQHLRLESDTRGWVLHGFATWWPIRDKVTTPQDLIALRLHSELLRDITITEFDLLHWKRFKDRLKDDSLESTVAAVGILEIGKVNDEAQRRFLGSVLAYEAPHDFRAMVHDARYNVPYLLRASTDWDLGLFAKRWTESLRADPESKP